MKSLLSDTPLFPTDSNQFECEWIRINVEEQQEVECGARACLHAYIVVASVRDKEMNLNFMITLRNTLQGFFQNKDTKDLLKKSRTWARQSIALKRLLNFDDIDDSFLQLNWKEALQHRKKEKGRFQRRKHRNQQRQSTAEDKSSTSIFPLSTPPLPILLRN